LFWQQADGTERYGRDRFTWQHCTNDRDAKTPRFLSARLTASVWWSVSR
jgi:hypothetical protein